MKIFTGKVISTSMAKTAKVSVKRFVAHPIYKKRIRLKKTYNVHDEIGVKVGQVVRFVGSKPFSRTKKWKILDTDANPNKKASTVTKSSTQPKSDSSVKAKTKKENLKI